MTVAILQSALHCNRTNSSVQKADEIISFTGGFSVSKSGSVFKLHCCRNTGNKATAAVVTICASTMYF